MSIRRNIIASYISQIYVTLIGVAILPLYIRYMGAEAYGLVGFFSLLQVMFGMLDMGLTPTVSRETARFCAGTFSTLEYIRLVRALKLIFAVIAGIGAALLLSLSGPITGTWLNVETLPLPEVHLAIQIMSISVALRWMGGLFRGIVTGSEKIVWLGAFNMAMATLRFVGVLPVMWHFGATPSVFFYYQLAVAIVELAVLFIRSQILVPKMAAGQKEKIGWSLKPVRPLLGFSLSIAATSSIWAIATQTDKLIVSKLVSLTEYGYFTLAVLVASAIALIAAPIGIVLQPRMARLYAENNQKTMLSHYRKSTQLVMVITWPVAAVLFVMSEPVLLVWTGDRQIAEAASVTLGLYALGYGFQSVGAMAFYLQFAVGKLKLHVIGSVLYVAILVPAMVFSVTRFGAPGAGAVWLIVNLVFFLFWTPVIHRSLYKGLHYKWLAKDIGPIALALIVVTAAYLLFAPDIGVGERSTVFYVLEIAVFALLCVSAAAAASAEIRKFVLHRIRSLTRRAA